MNSHFNLSANLQWPETQREDIFFPVRKRSIKVKRIQTGWKTLYRNEDGNANPISVVGPNYKLIPNDRLHQIVEEFDSLPLAFNASLSGSSKNKRFNLVYDIGSSYHFGSDEQDGGKLKPQLVVKNSYDGSSQVEVLFGLFRMICSNMVVVPVEGSVARFQIRHVSKNNHLKKRIQSFLMSTLSQEVFSAVNRRVMEAKASSDPKVIPYSYFQSLPNKMLYPILAGIGRFSTVPVIAFDTENQLSYDLGSEDGQLELAERIWIERTEPGQKRLIDPEEKLSECSSITYNEPVINQWQLFNLVLKIAQYTVEKNRRIAVAAQIGNYFL